MQNVEMKQQFSLSHPVKNHSRCILHAAHQSAATNIDMMDTINNADVMDTIEFLQRHLQENNETYGGNNGVTARFSHYQSNIENVW